MNEQTTYGRIVQRCVVVGGLVALSITGVILAMSGAEEARSEVRSRPAPDLSDQEIEEKGLKKATFGGGCFWCTEAVFKALAGVHAVESGYSGGHVENPTYKDVCTGTTGHAEVVQIVYDPKAIKFDELLEVFWRTHDPTTLNRQGADVGTQYRSVIYYHSPEQKATAEELIAELDGERIWVGKIVTKLEPYPGFFPAEEYHQQYYRRNPEAGYCQVVIAPKVSKLRQKFAHRLRPMPASAG